MPENGSVHVVKDVIAKEKELASKTLRIQNKRFYLDVKQNQRGRFVKITEVGNGGQKSRILMSIPIAFELRDKVNKLSDVYSQLPSHNPEVLARDGRIASDSIVRDGKRYYLDLKENERGRFLRLAMMNMGVRVQIAIPAQGMIELRNALSDLIRDYASDNDNDVSDLPESKVLFVGSKTFYFDVGANRYGVFLRISEVRANLRTAVTIPEHHCVRFRDIITELASKMSAQNVFTETPDKEQSKPENVETDVDEVKEEKVVDIVSATEATEAGEAIAVA